MDRGSSYASQQSDASTVVRQRFSSSSYVTSVAGILKFILIVLFLISGILFLSVGQCPSTPDWYAWLYPTATLFAAVLSLVLYAAFLFAIAKMNLGLWVSVDIIASLLTTVAVIVVSVFTLIQCTGEVIYIIPAPLGLVGAVLLAANAAATYIMYKYQKVPTPHLNDQRRPQREVRRFTLEA